MTAEEKMNTLKTLLDIELSDTSEDAKLSVYLDLSKTEILNWKYSLAGGVPETVTDVPAEDESAQIWSIIAGYNLSGAENQRSHSENGISRTFHFTDMLEYIRSHVVFYVGV